MVHQCPAAALTTHEGGRNALAGLKRSPGIGVPSDLHAQEARHNRGCGPQQEGDCGEHSIVEGWGMASLPLPGEPVLAAQQHKDEASKEDLQQKWAVLLSGVQGPG